MIISHKYKFIFIKTAKTAGTSIEVLLSSICPEADIFTPHSVPELNHIPRNYLGVYNPIPEIIISWKIRRNFGIKYLPRVVAIHLVDLLLHQKFYHHIPAWKIKNRIPQEIWNSYYKFCVERNPFEKVISGWNWYNHKYKKNVTLDEYLYFLVKNNDFRDHGVGVFPINFYNYTDPITDKILVDKILNYSNLNADLLETFEYLGLKIDLSKMPRSKSLNFPSIHGSLDDFSPNQIILINSLFAHELENNQYEK